MYFKNFPRYLYELEPAGYKTPSKQAAIIDITTNVRFKKMLLEEITFYDEYIIRDGETLEHISEKLYGSPYYNWVLMLLNDIYDYRSDYIMTDEVFESYVAHTYRPNIMVSKPYLNKMNNYPTTYGQYRCSYCGWESEDGINPHECPECGQAPPENYWIEFDATVTVDMLNAIPEQEVGTRYKIGTTVYAWTGTEWIDWCQNGEMCVTLTSFAALEELVPLPKRIDGDAYYVVDESIQFDNVVEWNALTSAWDAVYTDEDMLHMEATEYAKQTISHYVSSDGKVTARYYLDDNEEEQLNSDSFPVYLYDMELNKNEGKRKIKVVSPEMMTVILNNFKVLI